jgi:hypothetical protein
MTTGKNPIVSLALVGLPLALSGVAGAESGVDKAAVADAVAYYCAAIGDEQRVASQARDLGMTIQQWQAWRCAYEAAKAGVGRDELSAALSRLGARLGRTKPNQDPGKPEPAPSVAPPALAAPPAAQAPQRAVARPVETPLGCAGRVTRDGCQPR